MTRFKEDCRTSRFEKFLLFFVADSNFKNRFTFKVTIQIEGVTSTVLECFSESMPRKKAAEGQAAEGALWYLEQLGYIPKS